MMTIAKVSLDVTEAVVRRCSVKKLLLEISQTSQENNCENTFIKKETLAKFLGTPLRDCFLMMTVAKVSLESIFFPGPRPLPSAPIYI